MLVEVFPTLIPDLNSLQQIDNGEAQRGSSNGQSYRQDHVAGCAAGQEAMQAPEIAIVLDRHVDHAPPEQLVAGTAVKWFTVPDPTVQGLWKLMPGEGPWSGLLNATAVPFV